LSIFGLFLGFFSCCFKFFIDKKKRFLRPIFPRNHPFPFIFSLQKSISNTQNHHFPIKKKQHFPSKNTIFLSKITIFLSKTTQNPLFSHQNPPFSHQYPPKNSYSVPELTAETLSKQVSHAIKLGVFPDVLNMELGAGKEKK
jgi:hypothetical protein